MSISSIGSSAGAPVTTPQDNTQKTKGGGDSTSASSSSSASSSTTITNTATQTNTDGSITTTTTYADGTTTTSTSAPQPPKSGPGGVGGLLDARNAGQGNILLSAQAQNSQGTGAAAT